MVGPVSQEQQAEPHLKPSRLRNEIRQTPSSDLGVLLAGDVQVPDSQAAVPDTQVELESLSPSSAATLARTAAKKSNELTAPTLFSRDSFAEAESLGESSFRPPPSVGFAFAQPHKVIDKPWLNLSDHHAAKSEKELPITELVKVIGTCHTQLCRRSSQPSR
ncbi:hypothetical protein DE146DRAFT_281119 [Phaeosphaeria sp. MPI-PUGE-AT-0046c]|nr:hypothetical protein DE146DRAFT_281119 [Phaeosphaeria sp. MPI-PUGE-AT-0046c]